MDRESEIRKLRLFQVLFCVLTVILFILLFIAMYFLLMVASTLVEIHPYIRLAAVILFLLADMKMTSVLMRSKAVDRLFQA